jgi:hypothetical protein
MKKYLSILICFIMLFSVSFSTFATVIPDTWVGSKIVCTSNYSSITIKFLGSEASFNNEFGYINNNKRVKLGMGHSTPVGKTFTINNIFKTDQEIILYIKTPDGKIYKTGTINSNPDKKRHAKIFQDLNSWKIGFEDLPSNNQSDEDYNDIMLEINGNINIKQEYKNPKIDAVKVKNQNKYTFKITITIPKYTNTGTQTVTFTNASGTKELLPKHTFVIPDNYQIQQQEFVYSFNVTTKNNVVVNIKTNSSILNTTGFAKKRLLIPDIN